MRRAVLDLSQQYGTPVCDLAQSMGESSPHGSVGNDVFIDHCHPNALGHQRLGDALAQCIAKNDLLKMGAFALAAEAPTNNAFRIDHYQGHRPIPGIEQAASNRPPGSPESMAFAGHQLFVQNQFDKALKQYEQAAEAGAPMASIQHSIGLTQLYRGNLKSAQQHVRRRMRAIKKQGESCLRLGGKPHRIPHVSIGPPISVFGSHHKWTRILTAPRKGTAKNSNGGRTTITKRMSLRSLRTRPAASIACSGRGSDAMHKYKGTLCFHHAGCGRAVIKHTSAQLHATWRAADERTRHLSPQACREDCPSPNQNMHSPASSAHLEDHPNGAQPDRTKRCMQSFSGTNGD